MYSFVYLTGALIIFPIWLIIFSIRRDLRKEMIILGIFIGSAAPIFEFLWFTKDYWHPFTYVSKFSFTLQEFLFGFLLGGISSVIYETIFNKKKIKGKIRFSFFLLSVIILFASFYIFTSIFKLNSIYSNFIGFGIIIIITLFAKPNLIKDLLISGLSIGIISFLGYTILLKIYPNLIEDWWIMENISGSLINKVPLEELVWFCLFGMTTGILYEFWKK